MLPWRHILLAIDFSPSSDTATDAAVELAQKFEARLTLIHVWEVPPYVYSGETFSGADLMTPIQEAAKKALRDALLSVQKKVPQAEGLLRRGGPAVELVAQINESKADLVILGTHGRRGLSHFVLGSVAEQVVQQSPVPVLTLHANSQ